MVIMTEDLVLDGTIENFEPYMFILAEKHESRHANLQDTEMSMFCGSDRKTERTGLESREKRAQFRDMCNACMTGKLGKQLTDTGEFPAVIAYFGMSGDGKFTETDFRDWYVEYAAWCSEVRKYARNTEGFAMLVTHFCQTEKGSRELEPPHAHLIYFNRDRKENALQEALMHAQEGKNDEEQPAQ